MLFKSKVKSQLNYCPLIWMSCSQNANNLINKIQEMSLKLIANDKTSTFEYLLQVNNEIATHQRTSQVFVGYARPIIKI